ncbi:nucleotidyltransferase domain-containing protein [Streptomyces sp. P38-E01]|uniref:Nucleotidyltransferase domain-containing protein n=1 Tax=Streptomyces tardus TaxID=2780544 RepID=A0A949N581_9ACTN|nr:nucleotidyltransferase domain-containing protein [Streptomyces tardus]MBU7598684.1 nucleotidyltransferase domain-containing protein [Streptomyces tardus]
MERLRTLARAEPRLAGVLLYGSWTVGEADAHSDIEAYVFLDDAPVDRADGRAAPHTHDGFDSAVFLQQLDPGRPLRLVHTNRFGVLTVVFEDLMRGEFHFVAASTGIPEIGGWRGMVHLPDPERAVLLDRTGQLLPLARGLNTHRPPEPAPTAQQCADELTNWTLMVAHLLARGELARAHAFLGTMVAPEQLKLCRLLRGTTAHWLTPSRALELDVPEADRARYAATTSGVEPDGLRRAARSSWAWSRELIDEAGARWNTGRSPALHRDLAGLLGD